MSGSIALNKMLITYLFPTFTFFTASPLRLHIEKADESEYMFRSADPGNKLVHEEPGQSAGE